MPARWTPSAPFALMADGCWLISVLLRPRFANDLLERGDSLQHLEPAVHAQRQHALVDGAVADLSRAEVLEDQPPDARRHEHHLVQALTSLEPRPGTRVAAPALEERELADRGIEREPLQVRGRLGRRPRARVVERFLRELELPERGRARDLGARDLTVIRRVLDLAL